MLQSLKIENFRCFQSFELNQLGRINLLVGSNNSGKTSILEAIQLLYSPGDLDIIEKIMTVRGEYIRDENNSFLGENISKYYEILNLFHNYELKENSSLSIHVYKDKEESNIFNLSLLTRRTMDEMINSDFKIASSLEIMKQVNLNLGESNLVFDWSLSHYNIIIPLSSNGYIYKSDLNLYNKLKSYNLRAPTQFISPLSSDVTSLHKLFNSIVLTSKENDIIEALKIIDPRIERIAAVRPDQYKNINIYSGERGGFLVKLKDIEQPITIGNLGDGIWRMLAIILGMVNLKNGILLVDEIDSGLHYKTMDQMWKLIWYTARKLNIQVFATTHSSDCWTSLANLIQKENISESDNEIRIFHIDKDQAIVFDESEIVIAAQREIEVR